jgi:hypothetical protein
MQEIYQEWAPFTLDFLRAYITPSNPRSLPDTSLIESTGSSAESSAAKDEISLVGRKRG